MVTNIFDKKEKDMNKSDIVNINEELRKAIDKVLLVDMTDLLEDINSTADMESKIINKIYTLNNTIEAKQLKVSKKKHERYMYYLEKYPRELSVSQIKSILENDPNILSLVYDLNMTQNLLDYFHDVLKTLRDKSYKVSNLINWIKYTNGQA